MKRRSFLAAIGATTLSSAALGQANDQSAGEEDTPGHATAARPLRVVAWNVACGQWCTPEEVADALAPQKPDIVLTNETPKFNRGVATADWSGEIARRLGLAHVYVGSISSANHAAPRWGDVTGKYGGKFKSILSRWPLSNTHDYALAGEGWSPASAIRAQVSIDGTDWAVYSLHIPGSRQWENSKHQALATDVLAHEPLKNVLVGGDFNVRTSSEVLAQFQRSTGLKNIVEQPSIDHILTKSVLPIAAARHGVENGPAGKGPRGGLSDHPYAWAELAASRPA